MGRNTRQAIHGCLYMIAFLSFGMFHLSQSSSADEDGSLQQYIILVLWLVVFGLSFLPGALVIPLRTRGLLSPAIFLAYITISPMWSIDPPAMAPKAGAFLIVSLGLWRLCSIVSVAKMIDITIRSLLVLLIASALVIALAPAIGISHDWRPESHAYESQWIGVFGQKQVLGMAAASFTSLMVLRIWHRRRLMYVLGFSLGAILTIGSGSRGGAVMATVAPIAILTARRYRSLYPLIVNLMLVTVGIAVCMITDLAVSGDNFIRLFGIEIDFTQRTFIWQYAIGLWSGQPVFGFGLNGFWRDPDILWGFLRMYGWVLDNFHSGYLAILVETGLVGAGLFYIIVWQFCARLRAMLRRGTSQALELVVALTLMMFIINLTETIFLRSTNYFQVLMTFIMINVMSSGIRAVVPHVRAMPSAIAPAPVRS